MAARLVGRKSSSRAGPSGVTLRGAHGTPSRQGGLCLQPEREYVGIDLHQRRSVIVWMDDDGECSSVSRWSTTRWRSRWQSGGGGHSGRLGGRLRLVLGSRSELSPREWCTR